MSLRWWAKSPSSTNSGMPAHTISLTVIFGTSSVLVCSAGFLLYKVGGRSKPLHPKLWQVGIWILGPPRKNNDVKWNLGLPRFSIQEFGLVDGSEIKVLRCGFYANRTVFQSNCVVG